MTVHDIICDCLYDELLLEALKQLHVGRMVRDPEDPDEPYITPEGYIVVRIKDDDPLTFSRALERRVSGLRIIGVADRTPGMETPNDPGT